MPIYIYIYIYIHIYIYIIVYIYIYRLANEVRYSRTQHESEKQCKVELQTTMAESEKRHAKSKAQMLAESDEKVFKYEKTIATMNERESILREAQIALQGDNQALGQQLSDCKALYQRSRDQLRSDQAALETAKTTITRLEAEIKTVNQDLIAIKRNSGEGNARNEQALIAYQKSMKEYSILKDNEIKSLEVYIAQCLIYIRLFIQFNHSFIYIFTGLFIYFILDKSKRQVK